MEAPLKNQWIEALRSRKYKQGTGLLWNSSRDRYCCLGVLAREMDCLDEHGWIKETAHYATLPTSFLEDVKLPGSVERVLMDMNDADKKTFLEIADWIEQNL